MLVKCRFYKHWYWDRYSEPSELILDPLRIITHTKRTKCTKRLPSVFEATEPRERLCGQCRLPGHTRNSLQCMRNIRRLKQEFETDRVAQSSTITMALDISDSEDSHINSQPQAITQVAVQSTESRANTSTPENTTIEGDTGPIWPGQPGLIYQAYLAEKGAWLAANPAILPAQYRNKRGSTKWSESWCRQSQEVSSLPTTRPPIRDSDPRGP